jgi:hypothetical protein
LIGSEETPSYQIILAILGMFTSFYPMSILLVDLGRLGRSLRMGWLMKQIRNICLQENVEDGNGDARDKFTWWIKNLVGMKIATDVASVVEVEEVSELLVSKIKLQ